MNTSPIHSVRPGRASWTHIALRVADVDATAAWWEAFTPLAVLDRHEDSEGRTVWLGEVEREGAPFVLVAGEFFPGHDPFAPAAHPPLGPFAHVGIELTSREAVDDVAAKASEAGCLVFGPAQLPEHVGYVCFLKDPDGHTVEFSFDQGVWEKAARGWRPAEP